jgi:hypothetical protein
MKRTARHGERQRGKPIKEREFTCDGMRLTAERLIENVRYEFEEFLERANYLDLHLFYEVVNQHASICGYLNQDDATLAVLSRINSSLHVNVYHQNLLLACL